MTKELSQNKKWYENSFVIVLFIFLFFPLGLFMMWKYAKWNMWIKIVILGLFALSAPYISIPALILWWFYKKSKFSKKTKIITTSVAGGLFALLLTIGFVAYANDAEPHLNVNEPSDHAIVQADKITVKGTYDPVDRKVWINNNAVSVSNGKFETTYQLQEGENKIEVSAGNWKRAKVLLTVTRQSKDSDVAELEKTRSDLAQQIDEAEKQLKDGDSKVTKRFKSFAESELTEDSVKKEIDKLTGIRSMSGKEIVKVEIIDFAGTESITDDKIVAVTYKPTSVWDEKDFVKITADTTVDVSEKLFKHPKVGMVRVITQGEFTDSYGKKATSNAVRIGLERTTAEKIGWKNFRDMVFVDYKKLFDIADEQWIHPAIRKTL